MAGSAPLPAHRRVQDRIATCWAGLRAQQPCPRESGHDALSVAKATVPRRHRVLRAFVRPSQPLTAQGSDRSARRHRCRPVAASSGLARHASWIRRASLAPAPPDPGSVAGSMDAEKRFRAVSAPLRHGQSSRLPVRPAPLADNYFRCVASCSDIIFSRIRKPEAIWCRAAFSARSPSPAAIASTISSCSACASATRPADV